MTTELDRRDLISLVRGIEPDYSVFDNPLVKKGGYYVGGMHDKWVWELGRLYHLDNDTLWELYNICKKSKGDDDYFGNLHLHLGT